MFLLNNFVGTHCFFSYHVSKSKRCNVCLNINISKDLLKVQTRLGCHSFMHPSLSSKEADQVFPMGSLTP